MTLFMTLNVYGSVTLISLGGIFVLLLAVLYIRGAFRWRPVMHIQGAIAPDDKRFLLALGSVSEGMIAPGQIIHFWRDVEVIQQARLAAIAQARTSIQFETFMMTPGRRAQDFAAAVALKARKGVWVQLLVDTFGARKLPDRYWQQLRAAGVQVVFYNPFDWRAPANFAGRTHRKLLIIDGQKALIGGAGISDLWDGQEKSDDHQPWLDVEVALEGEVVAVLSAQFQKHWQGHRLAGGQVSALDMQPVNNAPPLEGAIAAQGASSKLLVVPGTRPSYRASSIEMLKQTLIASARQRLWLSSPYFLPNKSARHLLIAAQRAGVDVRILTTGSASDKKPVYYASAEVYGTLLKAGIRIFEYQPSMLHAKMLLVDDRWVNTGSANFDYRSFLHNDELDIVASHPELVTQVQQFFQQGFAQSEQVSLRQWQRRSWLRHRLLGNAVRLVQWQL